MFKSKNIWKQPGTYLAIIAVISIGAWGAYSIVTSRAATFATNSQVESGALGGNAKVVDNSAASGSKAVKFAPPAASDKIYLGATIITRQLDDPKFVAALKKHRFNSLTNEWEMKCIQTEGARGNFNFGPSDKTVNFAMANGMRVRGHALAWYRDDCSWMANLSNAEAAKAMENHVKVMVGRYKGKIAQWDVVNEAFNDDGSLRNMTWRTKLGDDYIAKVFQWAHEADPNAELYYNEFSFESAYEEHGSKKAKSDAVYNMVKNLKSRGIPIHGVGFQTHSSGLYPGTEAGIKANFERLKALGVNVEITEADVINTGDQPGRYAELGRACKAVGNCTGFTTWGLYDGHTWLTGKNPLLLDGNYNTKPAYNRLMTSLGLPTL